jgi:hypothetical protein
MDLLKKAAVVFTGIGLILTGLYQILKNIFGQ